MALGTAPLAIHADRGTSMTSKTVAQLLEDLGVTRTHSRPHVSNDNPYIEAHFKTLKYCPAWPGHFDTLAEAVRDHPDPDGGEFHRVCRAIASHFRLARSDADSEDAIDGRG